MAKEQDSESDRLVIQAEAESQRRQMLRCADIQRSEKYKMLLNCLLSH